MVEKFNNKNSKVGKHFLSCVKEVFDMADIDNNDKIKLIMSLVKYRKKLANARSDREHKTEF